MTVGEEWARAELRGLRQARFAPAAISAFLRASQHRAAATRAARPALAAQSRRWITAGTIPWVAVALHTREDRRVAAAGLTWWLACGVMLDWHLGMVETVDGRPRALSGADAVTLVRAWLVPVAWRSPGAVVCATAGMSDFLDGRLARAGEPTRAGRDLEGLVDACFIAAALGAIQRDGGAPRAAAALELGRLGLGTVYALHAYFVTAEAPDPRVIGAGRPLSLGRGCGLVLVGAGRPRSGATLIAGSALASMAQMLRARLGVSPRG